MELEHVPIVCSGAHFPVRVCGTINGILVPRANIPDCLNVQTDIATTSQNEREILRVILQPASFRNSASVLVLKDYGWRIFVF